MEYFSMTLCSKLFPFITEFLSIHIVNKAAFPLLFSLTVSIICHKKQFFPLIVCRTLFIIDIQSYYISSPVLLNIDSIVIQISYIQPQPIFQFPLSFLSILFLLLTFSIHTANYYKCNNHLQQLFPQGYTKISYSTSYPLMSRVFSFSIFQIISFRHISDDISI